MMFIQSCSLWLPLFRTRNVQRRDQVAVDYGHRNRTFSRYQLSIDVTLLGTEVASTRIAARTFYIEVTTYPDSSLMHVNASWRAKRSVQQQRSQIQLGRERCRERNYFYQLGAGQERHVLSLEATELRCLPQCAPHMGGVWEQFIKSIKTTWPWSLTNPLTIRC